MAVTSLARSRAFYESLGWTTMAHPAEGLVVYQGDGLSVTLREHGDLAAEHGAPVGPGSGGFALAHPTTGPDEIDAVVAKAMAAGASLTKAASVGSRRGWVGMFADPDGHRWTVLAPRAPEAP